MWLRGATAGIIVSLLAAGLYNLFFQESFLRALVFIFFSTYISSMIMVYGKEIKYRLKREKGTIKWFDPSKGYGFLERDKGGDLFIHFASVNEKDRKSLKENTRVSYKVVSSVKGPQANEIKII
jgi:CspA family cold shock protein